jgi:N-glycosylase/DNA lyase
MFRCSVDQGVVTIHDGAHRTEIRGAEVKSTLSESEFKRFLRLERRHNDILSTLIERGPELQPFINEMNGLRMLRPTHRIEVLFSFICSANNHVARISSMVWSLARMGSNGFPGIDEIAEIEESTLRSQGFGYRGATIPKVALQVQSRGGEEYLNQLADTEYTKARAELMSLPGIGPKLADCICLFGLDHPESVPIDTHIWQQLTRLYHPDWIGTNLTHKKYDEAANRFRDRFGNLAGVAHQFLFVENMMNWRQKLKAEQSLPN